MGANLKEEESKSWEECYLKEELTNGDFRANSLFLEPLGIESTNNS